MPERDALILYWRHRQFMSADYWVPALALGAFPVVYFLLMLRRYRHAADRGFPLDGA